MHPCIVALIIVVGSVVALLSFLGLMVTSDYMELCKDPRRKKATTFLKWWLYQTRCLTEVKTGEQDPWRSYTNGTTLDKSESFFIHCFSILWAFLPIILIGLLVWGFIALVTTKVGFLIILTSAGIAGTLFLLFVIGRFLLHTALKAEGTADKLGRLVEHVKEVE